MARKTPQETYNYHVRAAQRLQERRAADVELLSTNPGILTPGGWVGMLLLHGIEYVGEHYHLCSAGALTVPHAENADIIDLAAYREQ